MQVGKPVKNSLSAMALRFSCGAGTGALITVAPFSAGYTSQLSVLQLSLCVFVIVASGAMSCFWGDRFLDSVSKALDSTSV